MLWSEEDNGSYTETFLISSTSFSNNKWRMLLFLVGLSVRCEIQQISMHSRKIAPALYATFFSLAAISSYLTLLLAISFPHFLSPSLSPLLSSHHYPSLTSLFVPSSVSLSLTHSYSIHLSLYPTYSSINPQPPFSFLSSSLFLIPIWSLIPSPPSLYLNLNASSLESS